MWPLWGPKSKGAMPSCLHNTWRDLCRDPHFMDPTSRQVSKHEWGELLVTATMAYS